VLRFVWVFVLSAAVVMAQDALAPAGLKKAIERQQTGKYTEAIEAYRALLRAQPDATGGRSNLGAALAHEGRFAEATGIRGCARRERTRRTTASAIILDLPTTDPAISPTQPNSLRRSVPLERRIPTCA